MAIDKFDEDLAIISKLGDNPGADNGLSTSAFRAKFDEAGLKIQKFINDVIIPALGATANPENGLVMKGHINMNGYRVSGLRIPTANDHAASKEYVDGKLKAAVVTLRADGWINKKQTINAEGITSTAIIITAPDSEDENLSEYMGCGIRAISQGSNALMFQCDEIPTADVTVNVAFWQ